MARKQAAQTERVGGLFGAARAVKQFFTRGRGKAQEAEPQLSAPVRQTHHASTTEPKASAQPAPVIRRENDIPLDLIEQSYTPHATSSKASFRSDGSDHQDDQEFTMGVVDEGWNEEDRFTNKSGDPRIGTHGRATEPFEALTDSRE